MEDDITNQQQTGSQSNKSFKETFRSGSPDEVRDRVKDAVEKGVAAVAGALKGFADLTEKEHVADNTKRAVHSAGETARSTVSSVTEEARNLREPLREAGQKLRETARDIRSDISSETSKTKDALSSSSSTSGMSKGIGGSVDESASGYSAYQVGGSTSGMASKPGSSESWKGEFPDIKNTPLAKSDKALEGKDLTEDIDK